MRAIPKGFREGSLALGAPKWTAIRAMSSTPCRHPDLLDHGHCTGCRETAPIMFTAALPARPTPLEGLSKPTDFFFQGVMALPYHIYAVSSRFHKTNTRTMQYGAAFVFLFIVGFRAEQYPAAYSRPQEIPLVT